MRTPTYGRKAAPGDVGFEQTLLDTQLTFGVTYFRNNIKNLITDNADFTSCANVGRAMTQGVESFVAYLDQRQPGFLDSPAHCPRLHDPGSGEQL